MLTCMDGYLLMWLALLVLFLLVEATTVALVSVWFAAGAVAALLVSFWGGTLLWQFVAFAVVSALLLLCLRPFARRFIVPNTVKTNVDSVAGSQGVVLEPIDNLLSTGRIRLGALEWAARSTDGRPIPAGTQIRADRVEGVKVFVTSIETEHTSSGG